MECPGASPAGRGVYRLVAVFSTHSIDLRRCQVQRGIPLHSHERFHAARRRIAAMAIFNHPLRTIGCATRQSAYNIPGMASIIGDGSGSFSNA